nr:hypothetical protein GCM10020093_089290 [Planobispora longispora]
MVEAARGDVLGGGPAAPHVQPDQGRAVPQDGGGVRERQRQRGVERPGDVPDAVFQLQAGQSGGRLRDEPVAGNGAQAAATPSASRFTEPVLIISLRGCAMAGRVSRPTDIFRRASGRGHP